MRLAHIPAIFLLTTLSCAQASNSTVNFEVCWQNVTNPTSPWYNSTGGRSINGDKLSSMAGASAISYLLCIEACGPGPEPFDWSNFSQQFSAWLLPWLALISQLPFGAGSRPENLMSVILAVGSPTLAAYSLALTVLNERWVARRFSSYNFKATKARHILTNLQQTHIKITSSRGLLASLVILPENDQWWDKLAKSLEYTRTISISAVTSIAWVIIAYVFTVINSFFDLLENINSSGQAVGSVWLWLLPIVVGWLQISPKCDKEVVKKAIEEANNNAYVAAPSTDKQPISSRHIDMASHLSQPIASSSFHSSYTHIPDGPSSSPPPAVLSDDGVQAFSIRRSIAGIAMQDEECNAPIYNYTRFWSWVLAVNEVSTAFHHASDKANAHMAVHHSAGWEKGKGDKDSNRKGDLQEVESYCRKLDRTDAASIPDPLPPLELSLWGAETFLRVFVAAGMALFLQWGTTGAAVFMMWFTPAKGLGCRSVAYLLYAGVSTFIWVIMTVASVLAHVADAHSYARPSEASFDPEKQTLLSTGTNVPAHPYPPEPNPTAHTSPHEPIGAHPHRHSNRAATLSTLLRISGKILATLNAIGIIVTCIFQFSNFFNRCFCNSCVFSLGHQKGYAVLDYASDPDLPQILTNVWRGGIVMALASAFGFIGFVGLFREPAGPY